VPTFRKESYCIYSNVFIVLYLSYCIYHVVNTILDGQVTPISNDYICVEPTHMEYNNRVVK
jgi:hypothetical protein